MKMIPLKLHLKTTLLVSVITLTVMIALLLLITARLVDVIRKDEKALTESKAISLAEHFGGQTALPDVKDLEQASDLIRSARLDAVQVRIWERAGDELRLRQETGSSAAVEEIPAEMTRQLLKTRVVRLESESVDNADDSGYRVIAPIVHKGIVTGAIEISDHLDNLPDILKQVFGTAVVLALIAVVLITLATYILFRDLVYQPIARILAVIEHAAAGSLDVQVPERRSDEIGLLARAFNRMLRQLHEMTSKLEQQRETLRDRVSEATAQLEERNHQLEAASQELWLSTRRLTQLERLAAAGQTAAQFAHEVGTPLNLISCHAQLIQAEGDSGSVVRERADIIFEQTERIERIVRQMLDRTRTKATTLYPLDLNVLVGRIINATAPLLEEHGVRLSLSSDPALPRIAGDTDKLQQVFINLINNALDAMPEGGELRIASWAEQHDSGRFVNLLVADTGCGMSAEIKAHIFDPLYTTKHGRGAGLGLVVVSQVMQEHGGRVTVDSSAGHGSVFQLIFPAADSGEAAITAPADLPVPARKG